jgi:hypothetical protein
MPSVTAPQAAQHRLAYEAAACSVERDQLAAADVEVQSLQAEHTCLLALPDHGKAPKMRKRSADGSKLESRLLTVLRHVILRDLRIVEQGKPTSDEV